MVATPETRDGAVARHTLYNVLGQGLPLLVALAAVPVLLRGLGEAGFGILALVWTLVTLLGEVGVARAGTRFAAAALGAGRPGQVAGIMKVTLRAQLVLGVVLGGGLAALSPWLAEGVFSVGPELRGDAVTSFTLVALFLPVLALGAGYRGLLEAAHRFGALNAIRFVGTTLVYLAPVAALWAGAPLPWLVASVLGARGLMVVALQGRPRTHKCHTRGSRAPIPSWPGPRCSGPRTRRRRCP